MQFKGQVPSMKLIEICANTLLFRSQGQLGGSQWKPWKHIMQGMKPISSQPGTESCSQSKPSFTNKSDLKPMDKDKFIEISDFYFFSNFCKIQHCWVLQKTFFCKTQQCWILQKSIFAKPNNVGFCRKMFFAKPNNVGFCKNCKN